MFQIDFAMAKTQTSKPVTTGSGPDALNWAAEEDNSTQEAFGNEDIILGDKEEDRRLAI